MLVSQEEIFGPILPLVPYDTTEEAIAYVNAHERPLALDWFGRHAKSRDKVLRQTISAL
jgi:coniferyl-aldehyde dehydrogenase